MFCAYCGTHNEVGVGFCSSCGKPPTGTVIVNQQRRKRGYPLSNMTAKLFSLLFEIVLWAIMISGVVGGGVIGGFLGDNFNPYLAPFRRNPSYIFVGVILGGIIAFIMIVLIGGLVSLFIKLVNNTDEIRKKIQ